MDIFWDALLLSHHNVTMLGSFFCKKIWKNRRIGTENRNQADFFFGNSTLAMVANSEPSLLVYFWLDSVSMQSFVVSLSFSREFVSFDSTTLACCPRPLSSYPPNIFGRRENPLRCLCELVYFAFRQYYL